MGAEQLPGPFYVSGCDAQFLFHCANSCPAQEYAQHDGASTGASAAPTLSAHNWVLSSPCCSGGCCRAWLWAGQPLLLVCLHCFAPALPSPAVLKRCQQLCIRLMRIIWMTLLVFAESAHPKLTYRPRVDFGFFHSCTGAEEKQMCTAPMLCSVPEQGPVLISP